MDDAEFRLNYAGPPVKGEGSGVDNRSPGLGIPLPHHARFIWFVSCVSILVGLFLNPWTLHSLTLLEDGKSSVLRVLVIGLFDLVAIVSGCRWLMRRNTITLSPRTFLFSGLMLLLMGFAVELALDAAVWMVPSLDQKLTPSFIPQALPDPQFGVVPNPRYPGHDANGFRNPVALTQADIVTIGDSFTYGYSVTADQSWPSQLRRLSGRSVYNMSFNGYGPVEELMLVKRAVDLRPSVVICGIFIGNDALDAFRSVYDRNQYPEYKTQDSLIRETILERNQESPLQEETHRQAPGSPRSGNKAGSGIKRLKICRLFFAMERTIQSKAYGILSNCHGLLFRIQRRQAQTPSSTYEVFETPDFHTILSPGPRLRGVNLDDPRVEEGLRILRQSLLEIKAMTQHNRCPWQKYAGLQGRSTGGVCGRRLCHAR